MRSIGDVREPWRRVLTFELRLQRRKTVHQTNKEIWGAAWKRHRKSIVENLIKVKALPNASLSYKMISQQACCFILKPLIVIISRLFSWECCFPQKRILQPHAWSRGSGGVVASQIMWSKQEKGVLRTCTSPTTLGWIAATSAPAFWGLQSTDFMTFEVYSQQTHCLFCFILSQA